MAERSPAVDSKGSPAAGALDGIRVVDLSRFIAGPYCAMLLGDMGADVIKVEPPGRGENSRAFGPFVEGESLYTMVFNRNKRSLTLDLRSEQGKDLLRRPAAQSRRAGRELRAGHAGKDGASTGTR